MKIEIPPESYSVALLFCFFSVYQWALPLYYNLKQSVHLLLLCFSLPFSFMPLEIRL